MSRPTPSSLRGMVPVGACLRAGARTVRRSWMVLIGAVLLTAGTASTSVAQPAAAETGGALRQQAEALSTRADSLREARRLGPALNAYERAADLYQQLGAERYVAEMQNEIGIIHAREYRYEQAIEALQGAIRRHRAQGDSAKVARTLNNLAIVQRRTGRDEEALRTYQRVLELYDENHEQRATVLNNLGLVHEDLGAYDEALRRFREALAAHREREDRANIAKSLDNLGDVLQRQGRYEEALVRFEEALELYRDLDARSEAAGTLNGIGTIYLKQRRYDAALSRLREAVEIHSALGDSSNAASALNNIGIVYHERGEHEKALETLRNARRMNEEAGDQFDVASNLNGIGSIHRTRGDYEKALTAHKKALALNREVGRTADVATTLYRIGQTHLAAGRHAAADSVLQESIRITNPLLETTSGPDRRDFLAQEVDRFHTLALARARSGQPAAALRTLESSRAVVLTEQLSEAAALDSTADIPSSDALQAAVGPNEAAVLYANTDPRHPLTIFVVTNDTIRVRERSDAPFRRQTHARFKEAVGRLDLYAEIGNARASSTSLLQQAKGIETGPDDRNTLAEMVRLYRHELSVPPDTRVLSDAQRERLGQYLYDLLLRPIETELSDVDDVVVVPDGVLSYLPFETLSDWGGRRVIDRWRVRYIQSLRVLHLLQERRDGRTEGPAPTGLLALGGAVYEPPETTVASDSGSTLPTSAVASADRSTFPGPAPPSTNTAPEAYRHLDSGNGTVTGYRRLGYGPERWMDLPGTLREVQALSRIAQPSTLLTGTDASEGALYRLSASDSLRTYRAVHLATHGFVVPARPEFSALVLSEVARPRPESAPPSLSTPASSDSTGIDGYLTMREISRLDLSAEMVMVSACETGLGRIYRGSGAVSLTQAFLRAGAGSVAVSLWPVYDASTSRFMTAVYRRAWTDDTSWSEALTQTKRAFASGQYGKRLQAPRFWAPFVQYGLSH